MSRTAGPWVRESTAVPITAVPRVLYSGRYADTGLAMNTIFEFLGKYKNIYRILSYRARARPRARARTMQHDPSAWSDIEWRCGDTLDPGVYSGIGIQHMPFATNLISFLRSVESHRSRVLPLKFAREVLWMPILFHENTPRDRS
jgi:hypothetical protein